MTDRIPDRTLERARLGELSDEEIADLVDRLEATEGSTERLDRLIEADAEFLERYPADRMAPRIRARLSRVRGRQEDINPTGEMMLSIRRALSNPRFATVAVAVALLISVVALSQTLGSSDEQVKTGPTAERSETEQSDDESHPSPETDGERSAPAGARRAATAAAAGDEAFRQRFIPPFSDSGEQVIEPSEDVEVDIDGIRRVEIDSQEIVSATVNNEEMGIMELRGLEVGTTAVRFELEDGTRRVVFMRVAAPFEDPETVRDVASENHGAVEACVEDGNVTSSGVLILRFLVGPTGRVMNVYSEGTTLGAELEDCVVEAAANWGFPESGEIRSARHYVSIGDFEDGRDRNGPERRESQREASGEEDSEKKEVIDLW